MVGLGRLALAGVMAIALTPRAMAADWLKSMVEPAPEAALAADPVELGTGWYLRGDAVGNGEARRTHKSMGMQEANGCSVLKAALSGSNAPQMNHT